MKLVEPDYDVIIRISRFEEIDTSSSSSSSCLFSLLIIEIFRFFGRCQYIDGCSDRCKSSFYGNFEVEFVFLDLGILWGFKWIYEYIPILNIKYNSEIINLNTFYIVNNHFKLKPVSIGPKLKVYISYGVYPTFFCMMFFICRTQVVLNRDTI